MAVGAIFFHRPLVSPCSSTPPDPALGPISISARQRAGSHGPSDQCSASRGNIDSERDLASVVASCCADVPTHVVAAVVGHWRCGPLWTCHLLRKICACSFERMEWDSILKNISQESLSSAIWMPRRRCLAAADNSPWFVDFNKADGDLCRVKLWHRTYPLGVFLLFYRQCPHEGRKVPPEEGKPMTCSSRCSSLETVALAKLACYSVSPTTLSTAPSSPR